MGAKSQIEWTEATWEPITGCSKCSSGCDNCYAIALASGRLRHHRHYQGLTQITNGRPNWTGELRFNEDLLTQPLRWRQPKRIFVCSRGDLFHPNVPDSWLYRIFDVMGTARRHTFQVLTKRPERMRHYCGEIRQQPFIGNIPRLAPLPNVWLGTSVEDQEQAEKRIHELLATPAAVRWVSIEPMLGPVNLSRWLPTYKDKGRNVRFDGMEACAPALDWVVAGGESGKAARPMHPAWVRSLRDQCAAAGVPFFFKQWGEWVPAEYIEKSWTKLPEQRRNARFKGHKFTDGTLMLRVGKRIAGHLLDGVDHREYPKSFTAEGAGGAE